MSDTPLPTPAPAQPPQPAGSPSPVSAAVNKDIDRRSFLKLGWAAFLGFLVSSAGATLKFIFPNVLYEPPETFKAGKPDEYADGVSLRWTKSQRVWMIRTQMDTPQGKQDVLYAMWARCTHLGCTPNWFQAENRFRCPCHGSNYTIFGDVIAGPAPRPMYRCGIRMLPSGDVLVDKSVLEDRPGLREKTQFYLAYSGMAGAKA
jgi:cytochrome b6-f complex iron-sulfur subunit